MSKFLVRAEVTISVLTEVEADDESEANEIASQRDLIHLCHQCASSRDIDSEWVTSGELDGSPMKFSVEEVEE